ncbi:short-chain dehydrogenase [Ureibacillus aquaedulcis]|uniref:Short-chain dehydrogenase n=1 Tax=Ureibacillus aquaedulcis TaxID=3058421 RepID=A0ABT8GLQ8_9BACL|nr:short-chain dehydrogenase [Ureibacillus sp. BA0131]MDN4492340.1 short-chain dehydrogenase [Ureibacillus sp. BA0131]
MGMWTVPTIIAGVLIVAVSYWLTAGVMKRTRHRESATDVPISKLVRDHPVAMNPIIIMYIIFGLFTGIIIFYYWSIYGY